MEENAPHTEEIAYTLSELLRYSAVELFNSSDQALDLSPYRLCVNMTCLWLEGTIQPFGYKVYYGGWDGLAFVEGGVNTIRLERAGVSAGDRGGRADDPEPNGRPLLGGGDGRLAGVCGEVSADVGEGQQLVALRTTADRKSSTTCGR